MSFFVSSRSNFPGQYRVFEGCGPAALCLGVAVLGVRRCEPPWGCELPCRLSVIRLFRCRCIGFPFAEQRTEIGGQFALEIYRFAGRWVYEPE